MPHFEKPYTMFVIGHHDPTAKIGVVKFHRWEDDNSEKHVSENNGLGSIALHDRRHDGPSGDSLCGRA